MVPAVSRRISRVLRYSGAASLFFGTSRTGLSPSPAGVSTPFRCPSVFTFWRSYYPGRASPPFRFGLLRVRSPLLAESFLFSFPGGIEMFQFPPFASPLQGIPAYAGGLPHSDIRGSRDICSSPRLFAACHVLLRLREPQASPMRPYSLSFFSFASRSIETFFRSRSLLLL